MADTPQIYTLLNQAGWIQSLSASLVADPNLAEDLVQDTWVSALEGRPDTGRPVRGWLATVLRNHVAKLLRGDTNRTQREGRASTHEAVPSTLDVVEKACTHRDLVQAVLDLDEPYRSTILMRFFEQLSYPEIARREGVTRAAINSRITRGLERLRQRLSTDYGGDRRACLLALSSLAGSAKAPAVASTTHWILMNTAIALGLTALGVGSMTLFSGDPPAPSGAGANPAPSPGPVVAGEPFDASIVLGTSTELGDPQRFLEPLVVPEASASQRRPLTPEAADDAWQVELFEALPLAGTVQRVTLNSGAGSVEVLPSNDSAITIDAIVRADLERVDPAELTHLFRDHVEVFEEDGLLTIEDAHQENGWSVSLVVRIPGDLPLSANSGAGPVTVRYPSRSVSANSGAGSVRVLIPRTDAQSVSANSGAGRVEIDVGTVVKSLSGNSGAGGVSARIRYWDSAGSVSLSSGAGTVSMLVPANIALELDLETDMGDVSVPAAWGLSPEKRRRGERLRAAVGYGGAKCKLRSGAGSVRIELDDQTRPRPL